MSAIVRLIGPTILLSLALPLVLLAVLTTSLAFLVLFLRVVIVQIELVTAFGASWLSLAASRNPTVPPDSSIHDNAVGNRLRPPQSLITNDMVPDMHSSRHRPNIKSGSSASLIGHTDPARDYEGVGGWRVTNDGDDDAIWLSLNSRLELPNGGPQQQSTRHKRSRSTQSSNHRQDHRSSFASSPTHGPFAMNLDDGQKHTSLQPS